MATLTSKLVISLDDRVSGPARGMLAQLKALQAAARANPLGTLANEGRRLGGALNRVAAPAALGFGALMQATQDFERALVGVQIAGMADNLKDGRIDFAKLREEAEATKRIALDLSEALRIQPTGLLKAGEAAAKMGLSADKLGVLMKMAGSVNIQDGSLAPEGAAEFLGTMGINFGAGTKTFDRGAGTGNYNTDITRLTNQLLGVANMTRTSAGKLQEGMRQFAPLYAGMGVTFSESAAMIGAMVQAGQLDTESGTALKSLGVRLLKPTSQAREAMLKAGIDRSQFMDLSAVSAGSAFNSLMKLTDVRLKTGQRDAIKKKLVEGEAGKLFLDENWQQELLRLYNDATGAKTAEAREANLERVLMSIVTGGGKVKMFDFIRMLGDKMDKGELTDAQMAAIGEGRHLSRYKALFRMLPFMEEMHGKLKGINSEFSDAGTALWRDSSAGRWEGALASLSRAFIRLRESEGITRLITWLSGLGDALAKAPPGVVEALGKALVALAVIAPVGLALSGIASGIALIGSAARVAVAGLTAIGVRLSVMTPLTAAIAGAGALIYSNWTGLGSFFDGFGKGFAEALGPVGPLVAAIATDITTIATAVSNLTLQLNASAEAWKSWGETSGKYTGLAAKQFAKPAVDLATTLNDATGGFLPRLFGDTRRLLGLDGGAKPALPLDGAIPNVGAGPRLGPAPTPAAPPPPGPTGPAQGTGDLGAVGGQAQTVVVTVRSAMDQVRAIVAAVDLMAEGQRIMETIAAGIRAGAPAVGAAMNDAMGAQVRGAVRGSFTDGGAR